MRFASRVKQFLPARLRERLLNSTWWTRRQAKRLAFGPKRLDLCAAQIAQMLLATRTESLEAKVCLEVGCGWVLSHALVFHLLGAKQVFATDLFPIAQPDRIYYAVQAAIPSYVRDQLAPFCDPGSVRERWKRVKSIRHWNDARLQDLGIEYRAPRNFAVQAFDQPVDFIFSNSVLEHVLVSQIPAFLGHLAESLNIGGRMYHSFHLEDHQDIELRPFDFLDIPQAKYAELDQLDRGNRLRRSSWEAAFSALPNLETQILQAWRRDDVPLPAIIDSSIAYTDEADLRTSHLSVWSMKTADKKTA